jgi:5-methylcytosine-specific restriction endonuclease McrA
VSKKATNVLVLNKSWIPTSIIDWKKGLSLIYQGSAKSLDLDFGAYSFAQWIEFSKENPHADLPFVRTVSHKVYIPEIIVLLDYNKLSHREVKYSRQSVFARDGFLCCYCHKGFGPNDLTIDHIIPRAQGGATTWDNVVTSCKPCNTEKRDRTPKEAGMKMHYHPRRPKWVSPISGAHKTNSRKSWKKFLSTDTVNLGDEQ